MTHCFLSSPLMRERKQKVNITQHAHHKNETHLYCLVDEAWVAPKGKIMRRVKVVLAILWLFVSVNVYGQPSTAHPRLWLTPEKVETLRTWATEDNPLWMQLQWLTDETVAYMDDGTLPAQDTGGRAYEEYPTETHAMLLAFMSQVHPDAAMREDYAQRARTLLMHVMNQAVLGHGDAPYRDPEFAIGDRSRWMGLAYPLTVDWIYPILTDEDKATIRTVFIRWIDENRNAYTTNNNRPEPIGVVNDPILVTDRAYIRWSNNNYYLAHMRNMGLMGLALDPSDDPTGELATGLREATGAWLYIIDHMMRTDTAGGLAAEGFEYSPQAMGYVAQFLYALYTAGADDPALYGAQVRFDGNPWWGDAILAHVHSLSPQKVMHDWKGLVHQPAWYGSGQEYHAADHIEMFGPLGLYAMDTGDTERLNALRWIQYETAPGGADGLLDRMDFEQYHFPILYFMLFDPAAPTPTDPRADWPTTFYASGMRRLLARSDWSPDATWFTYSNSWNDTDHQGGNAGAVEFYRQGEWLTKIRVGYDLDYASSDNMNTVLVENTPVDREDWRAMIQSRGSQYLYVDDGDPSEPIITEGEHFLAAFGDMTNTYNSTYENSIGVQSVTRAVVWLKPDSVVLVDRVLTGHNGFKRVVFNLTANAAIEGNRAVMTTPNGQQFVIHSLTPTTLQVVELTDEVSAPPAGGEVVRYRYIADAPISNAALFVTVLTAADAGATLPEVALVSADESAVVVMVGGQTVRVEGQTITVTP